MQDIKINITRAEIESFNISLKEYPEASVTIGLFTEDNQRITSYSISTDSWSDENKFDLPVKLLDPIKRITRELEIIATRHCRQRQKSLPEINTDL